MIKSNSTVQEHPVCVLEQSPLEYLVISKNQQKWFILSIGITVKRFLEVLVLKIGLRKIISMCRFKIINMDEQFPMRKELVDETLLY